MKICITQRSGTRFFSKFANISERDKLEVEVRIEDKNNKLVVIDLTAALIEEYGNHPDIGRVDPDADIVAPTLLPSKPVKVKKVKAVIPAYLTDAKREKDEMIARVREAQYKAAEEMKQKQAAIAAARAERLAAARKIKAEKEEAEKKIAAKKAKTAPKQTALQPKSAKTKAIAAPKPVKKTPKVLAEVKKPVKAAVKIDSKIKAKTKAEPVVIKSAKAAKAVKSTAVPAKKLPKVASTGKTSVKPARAKLAAAGK